MKGLINGHSWVSQLKLSPTHLSQLFAHGEAGLANRSGAVTIFEMASITLKDIPEDLRAQLENEAAANFRSVTQEALARLERTFEIDAALNTKRDQRWVDEALASGPESPLTEKEMDAIRDRILKRKAA